jgi:hypothetical protein
MGFPIPLILAAAAIGIGIAASSGRKTSLGPCATPITDGLLFNMELSTYYSRRSQMVMITCGADPSFEQLFHGACQSLQADYDFDFNLVRSDEVSFASALPGEEEDMLAELEEICSYTNGGGLLAVITVADNGIYVFDPEQFQQLIYMYGEDDPRDSIQAAVDILTGADHQTPGDFVSNEELQAEEDEG